MRRQGRQQLLVHAACVCEAYCQTSAQRAAADARRCVRGGPSCRWPGMVHGIHYCG
jgi:hypothetical protein